MRYIDDFVVCFQYRRMLCALQDALRIGWGGSASRWNRPRPSSSSSVGSRSDTRANVAVTPGDDLLPGFPCMHAQPEGRLSGWAAYGKVTSASLRFQHAQDLMRRIRHLPIQEQVDHLKIKCSAVTMRIRHGREISGALIKVYRVVERYWRRMLCSRSWAGGRLTWDTFNQIKERNAAAATQTAPPIPGAAGTRSAVNQLPKSVGAGNPHATFCGNRGGAAGLR